MKICCLSDLHGNLPPVLPTCDLVVIAGDICPDFWQGGPNPTAQAAWLGREFRAWLGIQSPVIGIWGNHDFVGQRPDLVPDLPWTLLQDSGCVVKHLKIWGTPWTPTFGRWAFMAEEDTLGTTFELIPPGTNVLLSHGPPRDRLDECIGGERVGSRSLRQAIQSQSDLDLVVCGHIHEARGISNLYGATLINASCVDERYRMRAEPWILVEL